MRPRRSIPRILQWVLLALVVRNSLAETSVSPGESTESNPTKGSLDVVVLTTTNFEKNIWDGSVWLVEFYAPWCSHCMSFAPTYSEVAQYFHSISKLNVRVGKVDSTVQKALGQRFAVRAYPSFFLVSGSTVYEYDGDRTKTALIDFASGGYKSGEPIPFYSSPMGPIGRLQGLLIWTGVSMMGIFSWVSKITGLSPLFTGCLLCALAVFGGVFSMIILVLAFTPSDKSHRD